jgi:hypothetical protein
VTARDALANEVWAAVGTGRDYRKADEIANHILNMHAHELAEKIRAERYNLCSEPYGLEGVESAADLIDPEVNK